MIPRHIRYWVFGLLLSFSVMLVWAQDLPQGHGQHNLRQNLFTLRALRMTQELELTEEQTAAIFPELNRAEKDKAALQDQLASEIRELRLLIKENKAKDEEFEARVQRIKDLREKVRQREENFEKFLFGQLTSIQKAKYIIFSIDFNRIMLERANRARMAGQKNK
ncbi:MAG: Spy/CpxP family protein refolding chaperone [Candidatus Saccharicenans sp.]